MDKAALLALADKVEAGSDAGNTLDCICELALFKPGACYSAARINSAGTKMVYTDRAGNEVVCWSNDWTTGDNRLVTAAALRAIANGDDDE